MLLSENEEKDRRGDLILKHLFLRRDSKGRLTFLYKTTLSLSACAGRIIINKVMTTLKLLLHRGGAFVGRLQACRPGGEVDITRPVPAWG
jgi:hypothetical protein